MFFDLSFSHKENYPNHFLLNNGLMLNTDDGWEEYTFKDTQVVIKGYANKLNLEQAAEQCAIDQIPSLKGNFCAFVSSGPNVKILHDTCRGFPMWCHEKDITNLISGGEQIWADCVVTVDSKLNYTKNWFTAYEKDKRNLTDDEIVDSIHNTLLETCESFLSHNKKPLKLFLTGGIDTTTIWSYIDHFTKDYEMIDYEYMKHTHFYKHNSSIVKDFWGYRQIHLWDEDCVLLTGGNGDENFLRGPITTALALLEYDLKFKDIIKPEDYHYNYLIERFGKYQKTADELYPTIDDVTEYILNMNVNDHQHWHLDKTITFTPFKDISILASILASSRDLKVAQARTGEINRRLISKLDPEKLKLLSKQKNYNRFQNL